MQRAGGLFLGTFNSERFWRGPELAAMPFFADPQADAMIDAMDEMQFVFCTGRQDRVVTRSPMLPAHTEYLQAAGFEFTPNVLPVDGWTPAAERSIFESLLTPEPAAYFRDFLAPVAGVSPYSILPGFDEFCQAYAIPYPCACNSEVVRKVNSKTYSHSLRLELTEHAYGQMVHSAEDIRREGGRLLNASPFLIKDPFGVSGKGNLQIAKETTLQTVIRHMERQEGLGKRVELLLEPLLDKDHDFSCQLELGTDGGFSLISVQEFQNQGFAFSKSRTAGADFIGRLERAGYFKTVEQVAQALYREGYRGPLCLDSMVLTSGEIIPIVEINARKSMGFINAALDRFLGKYSAKGFLMFFSLGLPVEVEFAAVLDKLRAAGLLFLPEKPYNLIPLSANTLQANRAQALAKGWRTYKGRLYASVVSDADHPAEPLLAAVQKVFKDLGITHYA